MHNFRTYSLRLFIYQILLTLPSFSTNSRQDFYFGNNFAFSQSTFDESKSYWTKSVIDIQLAANSRLGRIATSIKTNPEYNATTVASGTPVEQALYLATIGNVTAGTARRDWVIYWFGESVVHTPSPYSERKKAWR